MKVWKYALGWLAFAGLLLLAGSAKFILAKLIHQARTEVSWV